MPRESCSTVCVHVVVTWPEQKIRGPAARRCAWSRPATARGAHEPSTGQGGWPGTPRSQGAAGTRTFPWQRKMGLRTSLSPKPHHRLCPPMPAFSRRHGKYQRRSAMIDQWTCTALLQASTCDVSQTACRGDASKTTGGARHNGRARRATRMCLLSLQGHGGPRRRHVVCPAEATPRQGGMGA